MSQGDTWFDAIITGGTIVDGSAEGTPRVGDVGILGDRIAAVGDLSATQAAKVIDATGKVVCPGFIDVHVHGELAALGGRDQLAPVRQGVTTQLTSPDGFGWAPLPEDRQNEMYRYTRFLYGDAEHEFDGSSVQSYLSTFRGRIPINLCPQVPHGAVRLKAMGWAPRAAEKDELAAMVDAVREWMEAGAVALCTGLDYQPSVHADLDELVTLSRVVAEYGGLYAAHIRKQALGFGGAWGETFTIAERAGVPVHVSHERLDDETASLLGRAVREGIDVTFDAYLYPAGMSHLSIFLPLDVQAGSLDEMLHKMHSPEARARSLPHLRAKLWSGDQVVGNTGSGRYVGMTLAQAAEATGKSLEAFAYDLILEEEGVEAFVIPWPTVVEQSDQIIRRTALHGRHMVASDGVFDIPHPHPRGYGAFARVLRRFVRELGLLSLREAVHKMSGFPAGRFGLHDRGRIAADKAADLVVLDPSTVADCATWWHPLRPAVGIEWVLVSGEPVIADGLPTGRLPGRVVGRAA